MSTAPCVSLRCKRPRRRLRKANIATNNHVVTKREERKQIKTVRVVLEISSPGEKSKNGLYVCIMKMNTCKTKPENKKTSRLDLLLKEKYKTIHVYTYIAVCV